MAIPAKLHVLLLQSNARYLAGKAIVGEGNKEVGKPETARTGMPHALLLLCLLPARSPTDPKHSKQAEPKVTEPEHADSFARARPALPELLIATALRPPCVTAPGAGTAGTASEQRPWPGSPGLPALQLRDHSSETTNQ